jgi:GDP-D-mannose 3',5'-epimerase
LNFILTIKVNEGRVSENMAANTTVSKIYEASSKLAKYPFEPYWTEKKLKICVTGAGGFIAR